jgi:pimeloyl-ACP methyl ester carboxylesterase
MVTLREMAEDVRALALVLKHKYGDDISLFLMGHSWGGMLGTAVVTTEDYQHLFNGWIEVDGAHDMPQVYKGGIEDMIRTGNEQIQQGHDQDFWQRQIDFAESLNADDPDEDSFSELNERAGKAENKLTKWGVISEGEVSLKAFGMIFNNNMMTTSISGMFTSGYLIRDQDLIHTSLTDQLHRVTIPCLFIWGAHDLIVSPSLAQPAFDSVSTTEKRLVIFNNSGHSPMISEGDLFVQEVEEFIELYK